MTCPIYHITHKKNLPRILEHEGLWSDAEKISRRIETRNIAYQDLKGRRSRKAVPISPFGNLDNYVPFYFTTRSPMLLAIHIGAVENYQDGQGSIIYLESSLEAIKQSKISWCFSDGHAIEKVTQFFNSENALDNLDWDLINGWSWGNTDQDNDRKRRKQAEFLVHRFFPWDLIAGIGVISESVQREVQDWYYDN